MKTIIPRIRALLLTLLASTSFVVTTLAQDVSIPDPGLDAAIRQALNKPVGPLTAQDLLGLTNLDARSRSISGRLPRGRSTLRQCLGTGVKCPWRPDAVMESMMSSANDYGAHYWCVTGDDEHAAAHETADR